MKTKKQTQTDLKRKELVTYILNKYRNGGRFSYKDIQQAFPSSVAHIMALFFLEKLGYLDRPMKGVYLINSNLTDTNIDIVVEKIRKLGCEASEKSNIGKRERRIAQFQNELKNKGTANTHLKPIHTISDYPDAALIVELKKRGYKIMKPINQYEEV